MFTTTRKQFCRGLASLFVFSLLATNAQAQQQPLFPGFPGATPPGTPGAGGAVYTPFNPLMSSVSPTQYQGGAFVPPGWYPPPFYQLDPVGSYLYGSAATVGSVGQFYINKESAQVLRQVALQKQIETTKMMFDLRKYIKENTPTFTEEQMKLAEKTLERILKNAQPGEIWSGNALNVLLKDLKMQDLDKSAKTATLPEETLRQLNITVGNHSLGILRDKGHFNWPIALLDEQLAPKEQRDAMVIQAEQLVKKAMHGQLDPNAWKDLKVNVSSLRKKLASMVLKIPASNYMQAKRFLDQFDDALLALQGGPSVALAFADYQNFIKGGKTVQELVEYMRKKGLSFAPSSPGDEGAYDALYSALANYNLQFHTQLAADINRK